jgi:hypothetical protein
LFWERGQVRVVGRPRGRDIEQVRLAPGSADATHASALDYILAEIGANQDEKFREEGVHAEEE